MTTKQFVLMKDQWMHPERILILTEWVVFKIESIWSVTESIGFVTEPIELYHLDRGFHVSGYWSMSL